MTKVFMAAAVALPLALAAGLAQEPLAVVDGEEILPAELTISPEERKLEQQLYELRAKALTNAITTKLLEKEAERLGVTVQELYSTEVESKVGAPTSKEISDFFRRAKDQIKKPLKEVRDEIATTLQRAKRQAHLQDLVDRLQATADIQVNMGPPRLPVNLEGARLRGPEDAPVTVVEFSDFQCPYCRSVQPVVAELNDQYKDQIRWGFKDLPLTDIHPEAMRAAQVARCADEQGKFWEFRAKLFEQELFTDATYNEIAGDLDLDAESLLECAASEKFRRPVIADAVEGRNLGLDGTPAFLINGILVTGARSIDIYQRLIDRELELVAKANP